MDVYNYTDTAVDINEKVIEQKDIDKELKQWTGQEPEQILRLSFNGQNRNTDFVKSTKAKDRTSSLLKFMGLKYLDDIVKGSDPKNRKKLKTKYDQFSDEYQNTAADIESIDKLFQSNQWGTIKQYEEKVIFLIAELNSFQDEIIHTEIRHNLPILSDGLKSLIDSLGKIKLLRESLEKQKDVVLDCIAEAVKYRLQKELVQIQEFLNGASLLKETDLKQLQERKNYLDGLQDMYRNSIAHLKGIKQETELNVMILESTGSDSAIGITESEKVQYETYIAMLQKIEMIGSEFSVSGNYDYNEYDIERAFRRSEKYVGFLKDYENDIMMQRQHMTEIEGMFAEQKKLLLQVQDFVNSQNEISNCPVCGGTEFIKAGHKGKDELLALLSTKIADGNLDLKEKNDKLVKREERLAHFKEEVNINIRAKYRSHLESLQSEIKQRKDYILQECDLRIKSNEESSHKCGTWLWAISSQIKWINEFAEKFQFRDIELEEMVKVKENLKSRIEDVLRVRFQTDGINNFERTGEKKHIMPLFRERNLMNRILECINKILQYDIGEENQSILKQYEEKCAKQHQLKDKVTQLKDALDFRQIINENSKSLKTELLKNLVEDNQMINWVYGKINPHPYFREINFKFMNDETSILAAEDNNVYLDNIFSEAQMNILSLSIFMGLILAVKNYNFEQIFLDDPVQSLDDINVVSFIDLVRALIRSKYINKNYIISTHDHNFSKLLKIKLRNYNFVEYSFISYGEEGPRIISNINMIKDRNDLSQ